MFENSSRTLRVGTGFRLLFQKSPKASKEKIHEENSHDVCRFLKRGINMA